MAQQSKSDTRSGGPLALLTARRFAPFFWTQFSGALNDNLFKTALAVLVTYAASTAGGNGSQVLVNLAAGLFIAPFFLFSALAGQLADKYEKSMLIRRIKLAEIAIMGCAAGAWVLDWQIGLLVLLFAMGTQSTFFGPVKYSLLPQHLRSDELVGGNGMVEMGTFVAILIGTMGGGALIALENGRLLVAAAVVTVALCGWAASRRIPVAPAADPQLKIRWHLVRETGAILKAARKDREVFLAMMGISWFWFAGAAYLTQLPLFARDVLGCDAGIIPVLLAVFSIGIAVGSLLCERFSGKRVDLGLILIGSVGMGLFGFDLVQAYHGTPGSLMSMGAFFKTEGAVRVLADLAMIGLFGGLYIVPLFAFVQLRTPEKVRSRIIAANNVLNALFMVASAAAAALLLGLWQISLPSFFVLIALANLMVALYICYRLPFVPLRIVAWVLTHTLYRFRKQGLERIPENGAAVLVSNHVSYVDALFIYAASRRPVRFVMHVGFYVPGLRWLFRMAGVIPIDSGRKNPVLLQRAFAAIEETLKEGGLICLFPEGRLTRSGQIDEFRPGVEKIVAKTPVPVVPLALRGLWGSYFSHAGGRIMGRWPKRFWSRIELAAGDMVEPCRVSAEGLRAMVKQLRGAWA